MGANSKIEWCDHTFNPWIGCAKVSAGCAHCYAERDFDKRKGFAKWGPRGTRVITSSTNWRQPAKWNRLAACHESFDCNAGDHADCCPQKVRPRVFCASLSDVFEDRADLIEPRARLWRVILATPNLDWLLLTKRPENLHYMCPWMNRTPHVPWPNVWLGTSIEDQAAAEKRIPPLLAMPARVRFLSCEPLLGPIDLSRWTAPFEISRDAKGNDLGSASGGSEIDWVIVGGESGPEARPMHPDWVRGIREQCQGAGVAFFFKQWGEWAPFNTIGMDEWPDCSDKTPVCLLKPDGRVIRPYCHAEGPGQQMARVGRKMAGRILDCREWNEAPHAD